MLDDGKQFDLATADPRCRYCEGTGRLPVVHTPDGKRTAQLCPCVLAAAIAARGSVEAAGVPVDLVKTETPGLVTAEPEKKP
jgi:hypothetical protein